MLLLLLPLLQSQFFVLIFFPFLFALALSWRLLHGNLSRKWCLLPCAPEITVNPKKNRSIIRMKTCTTSIEDPGNVCATHILAFHECHNVPDDGWFIEVATHQKRERLRTTFHGNPNGMVVHRFPFNAIVDCRASLRTAGHSFNRNFSWFVCVIHRSR